MSLVFLTHSPAETEELGRQVGSLVKGGAFIALQGELGGGKTCFTRGIVAAAAPESAHLVASPTFAIMNEYRGATTVFHFDFYRLPGEDDIVDLGFEEYLSEENVCIAEWPERLGSLLPPDHLRISFEHAGEEQRRIVIEATGPCSEEVLARLTAHSRDEEML